MRHPQEEVLREETEEEAASSKAASRREYFMAREVNIGRGKATSWCVSSRVEHRFVVEMQMFRLT